MLCQDLVLLRIVLHLLDEKLVLINRVFFSIMLHLFIHKKLKDQFY